MTVAKSRDLAFARDAYRKRVEHGIKNIRSKKWFGKLNDIAWTEKTFNGVWGCTKVSEGCRNCYAAEFAKRVGFGSTRPFLWGKSGDTGSGKGWMVEKGRRHFGETYWNQLHQWNRKAERNDSIGVVFVGNMNDLFEDHEVTRRALDKLWSVIGETPHLHYQFLTKRAENIRECLPKDWFDYENGYPNVWLGVSIEDQSVSWRFDEHLADIPAAVRFASYEPALGPLKDLRWDKLDWIIVGGESGANHRPFDHAWARDARDICQANGVEFFYKQDAARFTNRGKTLDSIKYYNYPMPRPSAPIRLEVIA